MVVVVYNKVDVTESQPLYYVSSTERETNLLERCPYGEAL